MSFNDQTVIRTRASESILTTNRVLRNTYILLGLTLLFSAAIAGIAVVTNAPSPGILLTLVGAYGLMFLTMRLRNSSWGLASVFAFTGFMGYTLAPLLNMYLSTYVNGGQLIMTSLGATGVIFVALSAYTLTTRKDFSYLGGFLFVVAIVAMLAMIGGMFFNLPGLQLMISAAFILLSSGVILMQTSLIINGGERNYIMATISLYVALYNLFVSLLNILSSFSGRN